MKSVQDLMIESLTNPWDAVGFVEECCCPCVYFNRDQQLCECPCLEACPIYFE